MAITAAADLQQTANHQIPGRKVYLGMWALFIILVPFFLMGKTPVPNKLDNPRKLSIEKVEGGVPQIADYLMAILMGLAFTGLGLRVLPSTGPVVRAFTAFVCYASVINIFWACLVVDLSLVISSLFYIYDVLLFLTCIILYSRFKDELLRWTIHAVAVSVFFQVILSFFVVDRTLFRQPLFFNSPLQVGYFAVLCGTIFFFGSMRFSINPWYQGCFYAAVTHLTLLSVAKASLIGLAILFIMVALQRPRGLLTAGALLGVGLGAALFIRPETVHGLLENVEKRLTVPKQDETWELRGYDRLVNHPEHLLFGAGEGAYGRFVSAYPGELHSSAGTLLFCYGAIGAFLVFSGLVDLFRPKPSFALALLPPSIYGMAEHGFRFAMFWVFLAFFCCLCRSAGQGGQQLSPGRLSNVVRHQPIVS